MVSYQINDSSGGVGGSYYLSAEVQSAYSALEYRI